MYCILEFSLISDKMLVLVGVLKELNVELVGRFVEELGLYFNGISSGFMGRFSNKGFNSILICLKLFDSILGRDFLGLACFSIELLTVKSVEPSVRFSSDEGKVPYRLSPTTTGLCLKEASKIPGVLLLLVRLTIKN